MRYVVAALVGALIVTVLMSGVLLGLVFALKRDFRNLNDRVERLEESR